MSKELVPIASGYPVISEGPEAILQAIDANLGGEAISPFDLTRWKVPGGGSTSWQGADDEEAKELSGIIIYQKLVRAFWRESLDASGGNTPPDCYSDDSVTGNGDPGGECASCPYAVFGSDDRQRGQKCKQSRLLFLLREGEVLPAVVVLPPSSLKNAKRYLVGLISRQQPIHGLITHLTLTKDKNADGIAFARAELRAGDALGREAADALARYADSLRSSLSQVRLAEAEELAEPE